MVDGTSCALRANLAPRTVYARGLHMLGGSLYELRYLKKKKMNVETSITLCHLLEGSPPTVGVNRRRPMVSIKKRLLL